MNAALLLHVLYELQVIVKLIKHDLHEDHSLKRDVVDFPHS